MMTKPILYSYFRSSASWRVRLALAHKGIEVEYRYINLIKDGGLQNSEEYAKINHLKQVPAFVDDGTTITQSLAIMEYLEEIHPEKPILPKDPKKRARVRQLCEIINSGIQPLINPSVQNEVAKLASGDDKVKSDWAKFWIVRGFEAFEKILSTGAGGKFCVGDEVTMADMCLVPQILGAVRNGVDMSKYPRINKIADECKNLEAFKIADWKNQQDCPDGLK